MVSVQPSSPLDERIFFQVSLIFDTTRDKGPANMLQLCLFGKIKNCNVKWGINTVK